jgi:hypothetical protein
MNGHFWHFVLPVDDLEAVHTNPISAKLARKRIDGVPGFRIEVIGVPFTHRSLIVQPVCKVAFADK